MTGRPRPPFSRDLTLPLSNSCLHDFMPVCRIAWSHGSRSSSVRGWPLDILFTFTSGCRESPSMNGTPRSLLSSSPTVDLPLIVSPGKSPCNAHQLAGPWTSAIGSMSWPAALTMTTIMSGFWAS